MKRRYSEKKIADYSTKEDEDYIKYMRRIAKVIHELDLIYLGIRQISEIKTHPKYGEDMENIQDALSSLGKI